MNFYDNSEQLTKEQKKLVKKIAIGVIGIIIAMILIFGSFRTINSGEVGIRVRFGKVVTTQMDEGALKLIVDLSGGSQLLLQAVSTHQGCGTVHLVEIQNLLGNFKIGGIFYFVINRGQFANIFADRIFRVSRTWSDDN